MRALYRPVTNPGDEAGTREEVSASVKPLLTFGVKPSVESPLTRPAGTLNSENDTRGNVRPHPGPLPQEREKYPQARGTLTLLDAAPPRGDPASEAESVTGGRVKRGPWDLITPFFQPPSDFAGQFGAYRSPLLFNDGTPVKSAADWPRRRTEILREWNELMGPWPPVIERPKLEVLSETRRENFSQRRVRLEIAPNQPDEGWLLVPDSQGPFPAVLVVYYEPETSVGLSTNALRDFGCQLARRGFVSLSIGTPGGNAWKPETGAAQCQPLSFHAYVAANCWLALANLPEVDRARIGVVGHSYGGKWALFAAALWDRFAAVAVSDPGVVFDETRPNVNYWEPWYLGFDPAQKRPKPGIPTADNPRTGAYNKMVETGRDLHELHALIAPRPFLVSGGSEDPPARWTALNHAVAVNKLLGFTNRVAMTSRKGHTPTEESNAQLYAFFEHFLGNTARSP
ncbi:MAG: sialidase [Verrucomicrobia bacterium]|nr:MAG: sialidase [Verrucomicrobiota bacterium]